VISWSTTWAGGRYQLYPNVDPTAGMVTVHEQRVGQHLVPVHAGTITFVVTSTVFL
jgi:hypothetical protein